MIRTRFGLAAIVATAVTALGAGVALGLSDDPSGDDATNELLATGTTSSGDRYTISRMSQETLSRLETNTGSRPAIPSDTICVEVRANGMSGGGCLASPTPGKIEPTQTTLGDDMIVYTLADGSVDDVTAARVGEQPGTAPSAKAAEIDSLRLFHTVLHTPADSLPTSGKLPMPPAVELTALDEAGKVLDEQTLDVSRAGG